MHDSIVLLGYSGAGKDTLTQLLLDKYPGKFANVKFSALTKSLLGLIGFTPEQLDGRDVAKVREQTLTIDNKSTGVSLLDLLATLFHGARKTNLHRANIKWALDNIPANVVPVFTDVRRIAEYEALLRKFPNPLIISISDSKLLPGVADEEVDSFLCDIRLIRTTVAETFLGLETILSDRDLLTTAKPFTFAEYAKELLKLNENYPCLLGRDESRYADLGFCLLEELAELYLAVRREDVLKEAGDVLAFFTLLLSAHGEVDNFEKLKYESGSSCFNDLAEAINHLAKAIRKWFRVHEPVNVKLLVSALNTALMIADDHNITFAEIMQTNISKLKDRAARDTLFTGSGDNR
jgi:hypothetical protein